MRRKGFTLIELLVVIAIIGILAGMLFPVFARAREAARKIQCLSNVKNIAMAAQMYLVDYDRFWPSGANSAEVIRLGTDLCGWSSDCRPPCRLSTWDPYLRVPVILDEYIKNRDVWRCPSAKAESGSGEGFSINPCTPDWYTAATRDGCRANGCNAFPPGWGGDVTDSLVQERCSGFAQGAFKQSISNPCILRDRTPESSHDVSKLVVCGDNGTDPESNYSDAYAYPDIRFPRWLLNTEGCGGHFGSGTCASEGYPTCGDPTVAAACTPASMCYGGDGRLAKDATYRRTFARHLGGDNLGFADGHAKWLPGDTILLGAADHTHQGIHPQVLYGLCLCVNLTAKPRSELPDMRPTDPTWGDW
jgi:prepilin-type N-terminal cleavage/methylation domain-containing protein